MKRVAIWLTAFASLAAMAQYSAAADAGSNPIFTNKARFRIPFRYDPAEMQRLQAREVQLFVSTDHGTRWQIAEKVNPRGDHFDFVAANDGEYWFAVRTLDSFNRLHPQGQIEPGLKVVIDATPPVLELALNEIEPGKVELRWAAADEHLDTTKLRLEYRPPGSAAWQPVGVVPEKTGQTNWALPAGGVVAVRGSIGDLCGNSTTADKELTIRPAERSPQKPGETEYRAPVAAIPGVQNPSGATSGDGSASAAEVGLQIQPKVRGSLVSDFPSSRPPMVQKPLGPVDPTTPASPAPQPTSSDPESPGDFTALPANPDPLKPAEPEPAAARGPREMLVKNFDFQIGYRLDDVGPSGISSVELFITQDGGRKWFRYGTDSDNKSPFAVRVPADGTYGFELRVKNGAGIGEDPPHSGDKPSIIVTVDKTAPVVQLLPPQIGRGNSRNKILLQWSASDNRFGATPVLLEYAVQASGPWQKIADWQPNTGHYIWSLTQGLPGRVFLRISVRDEAGNLTLAAFPEPLVIDLTRPTARIVDIDVKAAGQ